MNIIFGEDKGYSTLDNGELSELNHSKETMQEILSSFGKYKFKQSTITNDTTLPSHKNLIILAKDEKGKPAVFAFEKYGIKYIKLNDRKVAHSQVQSKKQYLDLSAVFIAKMIEVNGENYKNSALALYQNVISYCTKRIEKLKEREPKNEREKTLIQEEIEERQKILENSTYALNKINELLSKQIGSSEK